MSNMQDRIIASRDYDIGELKDQLQQASKIIYLILKAHGGYIEINDNDMLLNNGKMSSHYDEVKEATIFSIQMDDKV